MKRCAICAHGVHVPGKCGRAVITREPGLGAFGGICACQGPKAAEIPLDVARAMLERKARARQSKRQGDDWEAEIIAKAKAAGFLVHHVRPAKTSKGWRSPISGTKGFPDLSLAHPTRHVSIFVEAKTGKATLSPEQKAWGFALRDSGLRWSVWRPEDREAIFKWLEGEAQP